MKPLESDERLAPVMVYTHNMLVRGELIAKESVRVSILLRTQGIPNYLHLHKAQAVMFGGAPPKSLSFTEMFVPTASVIAFHLVPPAQDALDYDASEANRMMQPMDLVVGTFLMKGSIRISTQAELGTSLEVMRISWLSIYDAHITNPYLPQFNLTVPMLLISPTQVSMALA
ncbi:MAG: hypothetical protein PHQ36_10265 [Anaerolineales bacterium]|nr:hypothetical protein [Anaerolineales bacterium]